MATARTYEILTINGTPIVCDKPVEADWFARGYMSDMGTDTCVVIVNDDNKLVCACVVRG